MQICLPIAAAWPQAFMSELASLKASCVTRQTLGPEAAISAAWIAHKKDLNPKLASLNCSWSAAEENHGKLSDIFHLTSSFRR